MKKGVKREKSAERQVGDKTEAHMPADASAEEKKGRAAADALNRQIKEDLFCFLETITHEMYAHMRKQPTEFMPVQ